jgi:AcrR family transcriptional regulator
MRKPSRSRHSRSGAAAAARVSARKQPQQQRSQHTVETILKGAAQVLVKVGYDRANTGLIAKAAGVSVGSLYQYFESKEAVYARLLQEALGGASIAIGLALAQRAQCGIDEQMRASIAALLAYKAENPRLHRVLKTELGRLDGTRLLRRLTERSLELTEQLLLSHQAELQLPDPARTAFLIVNIVEGIIGATLIDAPDTLGEPALAEEISALVLAVLRVQSRPERARPRALAGR